MFKSSVVIYLMFSSFAYSQTFDVVDRSKSFKTIIVQKKLLNLISDDSFEGENFKIVKGKSNDAILFETDIKTKLKAATTYFHLEKARSFFVNKLDSEFVKNLPQTIIRIDGTNKFNDLGKFANDNMLPEYNNAVTIPIGDGYAPANVPGWNNEIWFRPAKLTNVNELGGYGNQNQEVKSLLSSFRKKTHMLTLKKFLSKAILGEFTEVGADIMSLIISVAGSSFTIETAYQTTGALASSLSKQWYQLETALVPEIIYHEFAHLALSDHIDINISTPLNEGMADYFAGKIANSEQLATKSKYNLFAGKKVDRKQLYSSHLDSSDFANASFVFSLLWQIDDLFEGDQVKFFYKMREEINASGTIRDELSNSLIRSCYQNCLKPFIDVHKLRFFLDQKGL